MDAVIKNQITLRSDLETIRSELQGDLETIRSELQGELESIRREVDKIVKKLGIKDEL